MQPWVVHWDTASPYISDKESYFCSILVYSTYISHSNILTHFLFWGKQQGRGCLIFFQQFLHAAFVLGAALLFKKCIQSKSEQFFKSFFHPQPLHLLVLMSPASKRHVIPSVHSFTYKTTAKMREKSETQALSLNLSQFRPLLILFSHLTQSFICTLGNLLIPLEELCSLCLYFLPHICIKIQLEQFLG